MASNKIQVVAYFTKEEWRRIQATKVKPEELIRAGVMLVEKRLGPEENWPADDAPWVRWSSLQALLGIDAISMRVIALNMSRNRLVELGMSTWKDVPDIIPFEEAAIRQETILWLRSMV